MQPCCHASGFAAMLPCMLLSSYVAMHVVMQLCCHACCYAAMLPCILLCIYVAMHFVMQLCCHAFCYASMLPCMLLCSYVAMHVVLQQCCHATVLHRIHVPMETETMKLWRHICSYAVVQMHTWHIEDMNADMQPSHSAIQICRNIAKRGHWQLSSC